MVAFKLGYRTASLFLFFCCFSWPKTVYKPKIACSDKNLWIQFTKKWSNGEENDQLDLRRGSRATRSWFQILKHKILEFCRAETARALRNPQILGRNSDSHKIDLRVGIPHLWGHFRWFRSFHDTNPSLFCETNMFFDEKSKLQKLGHPRTKLGQARTPTNNKCANISREHSQIT